MIPFHISWVHMSTDIDNMPKPRRTPRALLRSILMLDDTPHSVALGTTIGMFVGMTPTVGIQMMIVLAFAFIVRPLFRFNRIAAVLTVYVTNPLTIIPIYWFNYKVGTCFVSSSVKYEDFVAIVQYDGHGDWFKRAMSLITELGAPLLVGCFIVATICSLLTYPTMRWLLRRCLPGGHAARCDTTSEQNASPESPAVSSTSTDNAGS